MIDLAVQIREKFGKQVKVLRRQGLIPAELYGRGVENLHVAVPVRDFARVFKEAGTSTILNLLVGSEKHPAIIYNVSRNYLTGEVEHVDFYEVRMDEKIKAKIPVEFLGVSPAVRDKGGILNKSILEVEVEALPGDLPHRLEVDLSFLSELNQSIYIKDIIVPKGVKILIDPETPVVSVTEPRAEEAVEAPPVDVTAVKVETEEKKAERVAEKVSEKEEEKKGE